jgi:hypothetical protein
MKKHTLLLMGFITCQICAAQDYSKGIGFGLEIYGFDQAKVATEYLPSLYSAKVIQLNYLPQITYSFPERSTIGLYLGFGVRNIDNSIDLSHSEEIKTISAQAGLFYKYKFIKLNRFSAYCQSALQIQLIHQQYKQFTIEYEEYEIWRTLHQEREIYMLDMNLRLGAEYRIVGGLIFNAFLGNDIISFNWLPEQITYSSSSNATLDISNNLTSQEFTPNQNSLYTGQPVSRWVFIKNYIIVGGGIRYQF